MISGKANLTWPKAVELTRAMEIAVKKNTRSALTIQIVKQQSNSLKQNGKLGGTSLNRSFSLTLYIKMLP